MESREYKTVLRIQIDDFTDYEQELLIEYHWYDAIPECNIEPYEPSEDAQVYIQAMVTDDQTDILELVPADVVEAIEEQLRND